MVSRFVALISGVSIAFAGMGSWLVGRGQQPVEDPAAAATAVRRIQAERQEQVLTTHDRSDAFDWHRPAPISPALKNQPKEGRMSGFDFSRDGLNSDRPMSSAEEGMQKETAQRPATLRGIKESPPYLHDGRCLTLEDTLEFFSLIQELNLTKQEKSDLVASLRVL
jgi:cytochrome c peroxidase